MKTYRIIEKYPGVFYVQEKGKWWWKDRNPYQLDVGGYYQVSMQSLDEAKRHLEELTRIDTFEPTVHKIVVI